MDSATAACKNRIEPGPLPGRFALVASPASFKTAFLIAGARNLMAATGELLSPQRRLETGHRCYSLLIANYENLGLRFRRRLQKSPHSGSQGSCWLLHKSHVNSGNALLPLDLYAKQAFC